MDPYNLVSSLGFDFFALLDKYKDDPNKPKHLSELVDFEQLCRQSGYDEAAAYLESLRLHLLFSIEREWDVNSTDKIPHEEGYEDRLLWKNVFGQEPPE